jgi:mRNA-degrading endonuclease RelE of RelBE toxin-antitoxin system
MAFRIADTFTDSLAKLSGEEQKAVKTTAFDLQVNSTNPGLNFHKLDKARDKNFWSLRVSRDIRIIVHKTQSSLLLCYVDHHDKAYDWAERRKLETHPTTGAAQLVQIRETVQEIVIPVFIDAPTSAPMRAVVQPPLFAHVAREDLLSYGVPAEWLRDVCAATEDSYLALAEHLPAEAAEALLQRATSGKPVPRVTAAAVANPFDHPDAQRRFRIMTNVDELQRALEFPWDKWTVFLHPDQRQMVEREYSGAARVSGSAGTGKTIVALHRAAHVARSHPEARVLLGTFSTILANALLSKLKRLVYNEPRLIERIDVHSIDAIGVRLFKAHVGAANIAKREVIVELIKTALNATANCKFSLPFVVAEWEQVVDAWQLDNWEAFRDVVRLGRKTRLPDTQRAMLWSIFAHVRAALAQQKLITFPGLFSQLTPLVSKLKNSPFDFVVIDEAQDISIAQLPAILNSKKSPHRPLR